MANRFFDKIPPLMNGRDCILRSFGQKKDPREGLNSDAKPQSENQIYANQDTIN